MKKFRDKLCAICGTIITKPNFGTDTFCWGKCRGKANPPVRLAESDPLNKEMAEEARADIYG